LNSILGNYFLETDFKKFLVETHLQSLINSLKPSIALRSDVPHYKIVDLDNTNMIILEVGTNIWKLYFDGSKM
jgi:hypothetical protein